MKTTGLVVLDNKNMHLSSILFSTLLFYKNIKAHEPRNLGESRVFDVTSINNAKIGTIKITQGHEGIVIRSNISCLSTGGHGFHIHQTASCLHDTKFKSAKSHIGVKDSTQQSSKLNACGYESCSHGFYNRYGPHEGDLPNLISNCNSDCSCSTQAEMYNHMLNLFPQDNNKPALLEIGAAFIIHAKEDEHINGRDNIGNSGSRFACAEVKARG